MATASLQAVHVYVHTKPGQEAGFIEASLHNASNSVQEKGIARFDVLQQLDDPTKFVLVEVYGDAGAPALHKETSHYAKWRDTVADWMAEPRSAAKYRTVFPDGRAAWNVPASLAAGTAESSAHAMFVVLVKLRCKPGSAEALKAATIANASNSVKEPKVARFDFLQQEDDENCFALVEAYTDEPGFQDHLKTAHFFAWKAAVPDGGLLAEDFQVAMYRSIFPTSEAGWRTA